jgi:RNA recognition motif-containing protein
MSSVSSRSTPSTSRLKRKRDSSSDSPSSSEPERGEEVPVLSHAAKRKQKKALLKEAVPTGAPTTEKEGGASRPVKRENSIWVGNLCYKTTPESLRRFFNGVGEITRVHLPTKLGNASPGDPARRENRGCGSVAAISHASFCLPIPNRFAYVDFATPEAKNAAILMTESPLEGRRLLIKDGACISSIISCVIRLFKINKTTRHRRQF